MSEHSLTMGRPVTKLQAIEQTAMRLFASRGLAQVTIKDIAREAGCAEGALYRHYSGKEEMAWALFKREVERFAARLRKIWFGPASFAGKLREGIRLFYLFYDKDPVTFSFILLAQHGFPPEKKLNQDLSPDPLVLHFVKEGIRAGEFRIGDPALGAALLMGIVLYPPILHARGRLKGRLVSRVDDVTEAALNVLKARKKP